MISAWNLIWILPISACFGFSICALMQAGADADFNMQNIDYDERQFYFD